MDFWYNGSHSIRINGKDTWGDWHLIPAGKPVISTPKLVENYVDVPGANGRLDLTDILTGYPLYQMRTGDFSFIIVPDGEAVIHRPVNPHELGWYELRDDAESYELASPSYDTTIQEGKTYYIHTETEMGGGEVYEENTPIADPSSYASESVAWENWTLEDAYRELVNLVHGKKVDLILSDDPAWVYHGRITLGDFSVAKEYNALTMSYILDPFREGVDWFDLGDVANAQDSNNPKLRTIGTNNPWELRITLSSCPVRIMPYVFSTYSNVTVVTENQDGTTTTTLSSGRHQYPGILLAPGANKLTFTGQGRVWVYFKELSL